MSTYRHTQFGTLVVVALGAGALLAATLFILVPQGRVATGIVLAVLLASLVLFRSLTVEVTDDEVVASFGPGLVRRRLPLGHVRDARVVRNPWYYGWGVRLVPRGWMFNVSGLDAVELDLPEDRHFRIGTDEPERLLEAVRDRTSRSAR